MLNLIWWENVLFHWVDWWTLSRYSAIWEIALLIIEVLAKLCSSIPITLVLKNRTAGWWNCLELSPREAQASHPTSAIPALDFLELLGSEIAGSGIMRSPCPELSLGSGASLFAYHSKWCYPIIWSPPVITHLPQSSPGRDEKVKFHHFLIPYYKVITFLP